MARFADEGAMEERNRAKVDEGNGNKQVVLSRSCKEVK